MLFIVFMLRSDMTNVPLKIMTVMKRLMLCVYHPIVLFLQYSGVRSLVSSEEMPYVV